MATEVERLAVLIEAQTKSYENAMKRLQSQTDRALRAAQKSVGSLDARFKTLQRSALSIAGIFGVGFSIRGLQQLADASTRISNSLRVAGLSGDELRMVYDRLFASAQKNAAPIEALTELYGRAALVQKELGVTTEEMLNFTDKVAVALRVSGRSAQESSGALLQLSQALGSGTVRAEEFNSILEGALPIAQAAAAGLKEAGGSVAKLRQLVVDGKVSSEAFFRAFEAGAGVLDTKVASAQFTVAQGFVRLQNTLIDAVGRIDRVAGASLGAASGLDALASAIESLVSDEARLRRYVELAERLLFAFIGFRTGRLLGPGGAVLGGALGLMAPEIGAKLSEGGVSVSNAQLPGSAAILPRGLTPPSPAAPGKGSPVSLNDFASAGGDKAAKKQLDRYKDLTLALENQLAQLTMNDREQMIANELSRLGAEATEEQKGAIAALTGKLYDQRTALEQSRDAAMFFAETLGQAFTELLPKIETGNSALDSFLNTLMQTAAQALLLGSGPLAGLFGTASGVSGVAGGLFGSLFGGARAGGGPVSAGRAYLVGEKGPEIVVPRSSGTVIPNGVGGGRVEVVLTLADDIDARIDQRSTSVAVTVVKSAAARQQRMQATHS